MFTVTVRPATEHDTPVILQLIRELAAYEKLAHEVTASETDLRRSLFGMPPEAEVVIAESGGAVAGYALFFHNYSTFHCTRGLYLEDLFVRPEFRHQGIGRQVLTHLAKVAVARGCRRLEWSVLDWNESALRFYRSLGAIAMNEWTVQRLTGDSLRRLAADSGPGPGPGAEPAG